MTPSKDQLMIAVANLIKVKGRYHTEQAYKQLVEAYDVALTAPRAAADGEREAPMLAKHCTIETFDTTTVDGYVRHLTWAVWRGHYAETSPNFEMLPDTIGVLTQLDNLLTGWTLEKESK